MSRMVDAAATMGTGSDALKRKLRAVCFTSSTTSAFAEEQPADAAERLREASRRRSARVPGGRIASSDAACHARRASRCRARRRRRGRRRARSQISTNSARLRRVAVERVDALDDDERVLPLARLQDALEALGRVVVEEAHLGRRSWACRRRGTCRRGCRRGCRRRGRASCPCRPATRSCRASPGSRS